MPAVRELAAKVSPSLVENGLVESSLGPNVMPGLPDLELSYTNFFAKRAAFPRLKKKGLSNRFRFPQAARWISQPR